MTDPSTETWRAALAHTTVTNSSVSQSTSARLRETQAALAASQQDLTRARGRVVDLLYIIDAFQVESGADRNASYATGIEAVRKLRQDLAEARQQNRVLTAENESTLRRLNEVRMQTGNPPDPAIEKD